MSVAIQQMSVDEMLVSESLLGVSKSPAQAAATIVTENLSAMFERCYRLRDAKWMMNGKTRDWIRDSLGMDSMANTIFGLPIEINEACRPIGQRGDIFLVCSRDTPQVVRVNGQHYGTMIAIESRN